MRGDNFFESPEEQSIIKSTLVTNYFDTWSKVMLPQVARRNELLAYVDLFAGPGRYDDGSPSTPLWVLDYATKNAKLCRRLVTMFNDKNANHARQLQTEIDALPGVENLVHKPQVTTTEVGQELVDLLRANELVPTLFFIDPFGYKGLSLDLIGTAIKSWGCDCIFFFNYNRINPGITNLYVEELMNDLFGAERAERLRQQVTGRNPDARQSLIIDELAKALKDVGGRFVLPFEFQSQHGERTSHYIVFVSKAFLGYHLMKEVMFPLSSAKTDVRQFRYVPIQSTQMDLFPDFGISHSIPLLKDVLLSAAAGWVVTVWDVYENLTVDTPYTLKNVQTALSALEVEGRIAIDPPAERRPKRRGEVTLGRDKVVSFPK
jgi:three-Cys-motif partner protein